MQNTLLYFFLNIFILLGCSRKTPNVLKYELKHSDYLENIEVSGTIQAVNSINILAPTTSFTNLIKVTHLADDGAHVLKGDTVCAFEAPADMLNYVETFNVDLQKMEGDLKRLEADNTMRLSLLNAQVETNKAQIAISMLDSIQIK
jgi:hypothetical protein